MTRKMMMMIMCVSERERVIACEIDRSIESDDK